MAENISESIFQAVDTIIMKRLEAINFDNTDIYSITDATNAEYGEYKVTDGHVTFTAYSQNTNYKENEAVYVTIPNNDFNQQKIIIGKYTADSNTPFVFRNPTSTMIDATGNLIQGQIQEAGLTANAINDDEENGTNTLTGNNEEERILWQYECHNKNFVGFERLGIKADFKSWLKEFDCIEGHYGLKLRLKCLQNEMSYTTKVYYDSVRDAINKINENNIENDTNWKWIKNTSKIFNEIDGINQISIAAGQKERVQEYVLNKLEESYKTYALVLDSQDMIGDVYNFVSYYRQEQVFDITSFGQIIAMELVFYQKKDFKDPGGNFIQYQNLFGQILPNNLFTIDPYIMLGYDLEGFDGDKAILTTTDTLGYKQSDAIDQRSTDQETDVYNKKTLHLSWVHENDKGKIISIETETQVQGIYEIRWYRRQIGSRSPDEWAGVDWTRLTETADGQALGNHEFNYVFMVDEDSYERAYEEIKAIIIFKPTSGATKIVRSDVITFRNEGEVVSGSTIDQNRGLSLICLDGTEGNYFIYRQDYGLIDKSQSNLRRTIACHLTTKEFGDQGVLTDAKTIVWHIPTKSTMLRITTDGTSVPFLDYDKLTSNEVKIPSNKTYLNYCDLSYDNPILKERIYYDESGQQYTCKTTEFLYDEENDDLFIVWYGDPNNGYQINPYLHYTIYDTYSQDANKNKIICEVNKNNRDYIGDQEFSFGTAGTNGTAYTLTIDMYALDSSDNKMYKETALTAGLINGYDVLFEANISDTAGKKIDLPSDIEWNWSWWKESEIYQPIEIAEAKDLFNKQVLNNLYYRAATSGQNADLILNGTAEINENNKYYLLTPTKGCYYASNEEEGKITTSLLNDNPQLLKVTVNNNLSINNLLYLQLNVKNCGDYELTTIYPVPIKAPASVSENVKKEYVHIRGAEYICYPTTGYPEYYNNPYELYSAEYDTANQGHVRKNSELKEDVEWSIYAPHNVNTNHEDYMGRISDKNILQPADFYVAGNPQYGVQAKIKNSDTVVWTQPIWVYQNAYFSTTLNQWDGKSLQISEDSATIVAHAIAAGKKNPDNTFSGVMLGDWSNEANDTEHDIASKTGLYGFYHGSSSFGFMEDGTAYIGQSGRGRILFDGTQSTITSNGYVYGDGGTLIDLDDGYQEFINRRNNGAYVEVPVNPTTFEDLKNEGLYAAEFEQIIDNNNYNSEYKENVIYYIKDDKNKFFKAIVNQDNFEELKNNLYIAVFNNLTDEEVETKIQQLKSNNQLENYIKNLDRYYRYRLIRQTAQFQRDYPLLQSLQRSGRVVLIDELEYLYNFNNSYHFHNNFPIYINQISELPYFKEVVRGILGDADFDDSITYYQKAGDYYLKINAKNDNLKYTDHALEIGTGDNPNFYVQWDGSICARNGEFNGDITGGSIHIGPNPNFIVDYSGNVFIGDGYINDNNVPIDYTVTISNEGDFWAGGKTLHIDTLGVFSVNDETFKIDGNYFYAGKILDNNDNPTGEYTLIIDNEGNFEAGRTRVDNSYVPILEINKTGNFSAGNGVLKIDSTGRLTINDDAFSITPEGVTNINYLSGYEAYFENLSVDTLSILNQVDSDVTFNGDVFFNGKVLAGTFYNNVIHNPDLNIYLSTVEKGITFQDREYPTNYVSGKEYYAKKTVSGGGAGWGERTLYLGKIDSDAFTTMKNLGYTLFYYEAKPGSLSSEGNNLIKIWSGTPDDQGSLAGTIGYEAGATATATTVNVGISSSNYINSEDALCHTSIILESDSNISLTAKGTGNFGLIYANSREFWFGPTVFYYQGNSYAPYVRYNDNTHTLEWLTDNGNGGFTSHDYKYAYFA